MRGLGGLRKSAIYLHTFLRPPLRVYGLAALENALLYETNFRYQILSNNHLNDRRVQLLLADVHLDGPRKLEKQTPPLRGPAAQVAAGDVNEWHIDNL